MKAVGLLTVICVTLACPIAHAQISAFNDHGVTLGHLHYVVPDVEQTAQWWERLGGQRAEGATAVTVVFPGVAVVLSQGEQRATSEEAVVGHFAFRVASVADIEARGIPAEHNADYPGVAYVYTPDGERIELFDDQIATNIGFDPDAGLRNDVTLRHNNPLRAPIVTHHMHLYVPAEDLNAAQQWYVDVFGAAPGMRWRYDAADLPGVNLNFSVATQARAPMAGRMLDHVGFEVADLDEFIERLQELGLQADVMPRAVNGVRSARLTDPWGTSIELTEGFAGLLQD